MKARLTENKKNKNLNTQESFELNDLKSHFTSKPNPNPEIAGSMITKAIKNKIARKELVDKKLINQ